MNLSDEALRDGLPRHLANRLEINLAHLGSLLGMSADIVIRKFAIDEASGLSAAIVYIENLVDKSQVSECVLRPIMDNYAKIAAQKVEPPQIAGFLKSHLATASDIKSACTYSDTAAFALSGETVLLIDGVDEALAFNTRGWAQRDVGLSPVFWTHS